MRRALFILDSIFGLLLAGAIAAGAPAQSPPVALSPQANGAGAQIVDGIAVRIEGDIITESQVRELAAFQKISDGESKPRAEIIRELIDQWIVRGEADAAKYPPPSQDDVHRAVAQFDKQFGTPEEFKQRCDAAGLTQAAVQRIIREQLYLSRFLDFRFRPAAQVDGAQIETYYRDEFAPPLKARGQPVPPLSAVEETIREVLIQRAINDRATQWLNETRGRLQIDIVGQGDSP